MIDLGPSTEAWTGITRVVGIELESRGAGGTAVGMKKARLPLRR